jgi:hypothetical protein
VFKQVGILPIGAFSKKKKKEDGEKKKRKQKAVASVVSKGIQPFHHSLILT